MFRKIIIVAIGSAFLLILQRFEHSMSHQVAIILRQVLIVRYVHDTHCGVREATGPTELRLHILAFDENPALHLRLEILLGNTARPDLLDDGFE